MKFTLQRGIRQGCRVLRQDGIEWLDTQLLGNAAAEGDPSWTDGDHPSATPVMLHTQLTAQTHPECEQTATEIAPATDADHARPGTERKLCKGRRRRSRDWAKGGSLIHNLKV